VFVIVVERSGSDCVNNCKGNPIVVLLGGGGEGGGRPFIYATSWYVIKNVRQKLNLKPQQINVR
jgi:hypothetical protein